MRAALAGLRSNELSEILRCHQTNGKEKDGSHIAAMIQCLGIQCNMAGLLEGRVLK
jgi:hypothetical protein